MLAGQLEIQIFAGMARLQDDMNKATRSVGGAMKSIEGAVSSAKTALGALGIGLSAVGFARLIQGSIDAADHLHDLSKSTGLAVKDLAGLNLLAKQNGTDLDGLAKAVNKMTVEMGKSPDKFKALGITAKDTKGAFMQLSDVFNSLADVNQRNALANAVFGKSWAELAPTLSEGGKRIGEIMDRGALLSGTNKEMTEQADRYNDQMAELNITLGGTVTKLAGDLLPGMNDIATAMREAAKEGGILLTIWVGMGGAMANLLGITDRQKVTARLEEINDQLAIANKQLNSGMRNPADASSFSSFWADMFKSNKLGEDALVKIRANIDALEKEKARLQPIITPTSIKPSGTNDAKVNTFLGVKDNAFDPEGDFWQKVSEAHEVNRKKNDEEFLKDQERLSAEFVALQKKTAEESAKEWERFQENVQRNLGDVLYLGLQGKFRDIGDLFKQMLMRMSADAMAAQLTKSMFGAGGAAAALFGTPAVAATGAAAAAGPTIAAQATGMGGMASAMTAAAPYVAALAGAYIIARYGFGMGASKEYGPTRLVGQFTRAGFSGNRQQSWTQDGGWFGSDSGGTITTAVGRAEMKAFQAVVKGLQGTFNDLGSAIGYSAVRTKEWKVNVNAAGDVTGLLADGIGGQLVPALEHFREAGENLAQTAQRLTTAFQSTSYFMNALGLSSVEAFGSMGIASGDARLALIEAAGGMDAFNQNATFFVANFLTPAQKLAPALDAVGRAFSELGIAGVETNEQFAALVSAATAAGDYDTVARLLSVAEAFNAITTDAKKTTDALTALIKTDSFATMVDYQRAVGRAANGATTGGGAASMIASATTAASALMPQEDTANARANKEAARLLWLEAKAISDKFDADMLAQTTAAGYAPSNTYNSIYAVEMLRLQAIYESLPSYASGNPYVQSDMTANIHQGEMIVDSSSASLMRKYGVGGNNDALVAEIKALRAEVRQLRSENQAGQIAIATNTNRTAKLIERFDGEGMPAVRT